MAGETPSDEIASPAQSNSRSSLLSQPTHLRSCVLCRQRKVKCDRRQPCSNCVRAGANCVHPPGAGRAAKRPRQAVDTKVLDRLSHLEATIKRLQQQAKGRETEPSAPSESVQTPESGGPVDDETQGAEDAPELGRLVVEETQSRYVSHVMWAGLTESVSTPEIPINNWDFGLISWRSNNCVGCFSMTMAKMRIRASLMTALHFASRNPQIRDR